MSDIFFSVRFLMPIPVLRAGKFRRHQAPEHDEWTVSPKMWKRSLRQRPSECAFSWHFH